METKSAIASLSALAHEPRLAAFRTLVQAGPEGMAAGELSRRLEILPNTLSASLNILSNAGLVTSRRDGRSIIYSANYPTMTALLAFLMEDCCGGVPEICASVASLATQACAPVAEPV